jgi:hypothetical protein
MVPQVEVLSPGKDLFIVYKKVYNKGLPAIFSVSELPFREEADPSSF